MPPKSIKKGKARRESVAPTPAPEPECAPEIRLQSSSEDENVPEDSQLEGRRVEEKEMDYVTDLNEEFFAKAYKAMQKILQVGRVYEASKVKKYVDILFRLQRKYAISIKENAELRPLKEIGERKLRVALELATDTAQVMEAVKQAMCESWKQNDASFLREQTLQEKLQMLIIKCDDFQEKQEQDEEDVSSLGSLGRYKNIILRERDRLTAEVNDLEKRLQMQRYYSEQCDYVNHNLEESLNKLNAKAKVLEMEKEQLEKKIRELMNSLDESADKYAKTTVKLENTHNNFMDMSAKFQKKSADYDRQRMRMEKLRNENVVLNRQLAKDEADLEDCNKELQRNDETIKALRLEDKAKTKLLTQARQQLKKAVTDHATLSSKLHKLDRRNAAFSQSMIRLHNTINGLEKDLSSAGHRFEELERQKQAANRERDNLRNDVGKLNNQVLNFKHTIALNTTTIENLNMDLKKMHVKLDENKIHIAKVEKERNEMSQEVDNLLERVDNLQDELQVKNSHIVNLTEQVQQKQSTLVHVRKQLDTVHSEKTLCQRSLDVCIQERDNLKVLQTKTSHQISQFMTEIAAHLNKISNLNLQVDRLNSEKKDLQTDIRKKEMLLAGLRKDLKAMKSKNDSLLKTISDDELKMKQLAILLDETRKEKNLIGLQMVRRNDEIVLLKEKNHIMQTALDQGQTQYNQRVDDIRLLKVEITNLRTERDCLSNALKSTADMREEIVRLQRCLAQERIKVRALTDDARIPTAVHRWRILRGTDMPKFQLISKLRMLQRQILKHAVEKANLEQQLLESKKLCDELKRAFANAPDKDIKAKLVKCQRTNRDCDKKLKSILAEQAADQLELEARNCIIRDLRDKLLEACNYLPETTRKEVTTWLFKLKPSLPKPVKPELHKIRKSMVTNAKASKSSIKLEQQGVEALRELQNLPEFRETQGISKDLTSRQGSKE